MGTQSTRCVKCCIEAGVWKGANNGNWKGGRVRHHAGYVQVAAPGHPRATAGGGYVFEHILVIEAHLGRYLLLDETVHHLNGVRDDNRLENLELWVKPQPPGIRVKDAVAWAKVILERYETCDATGPSVERETSPTAEAGGS